MNNRIANHMAEIAKLIGLELGESFRVGNDDSLKSYYFRFTNIGLEFSTANEDDVWVTANSYTLFSLLRGELAVIKLPWKPKMEGKYYIPCIHCNESCLFSVCYWCGDSADEKFYQLGLVCKTREEAIAMTKKMIAGLEKKTIAAVQEVRSNG